MRNGQTNYLNTRDVIVSPPIARIAPSGSLQVRVLRTTGEQVRGEENFRVVVDEVPDANRVRNVGVNMALRYTIPLFYLNPSARPPRLSWSVRGSGRHRQLVVQNSGDVHVRLSQLKIGSVTLFKGLAGYALGKSTLVFALPSRAPSQGTISAVTGQGKLNARLSR